MALVDNDEIKEIWRERLKKTDAALVLNDYLVDGKNKISRPCILAPVLSYSEHLRRLQIFRPSEMLAIR